MSVTMFQCTTLPKICVTSLPPPGDMNHTHVVGFTVFMMMTYSYFVHFSHKLHGNESALILGYLLTGLQITGTHTHTHFSNIRRGVSNSWVISTAV